MVSTHPFEKAGLGQAPFRCVGMNENRYSPAPGVPSVPGGTCDYCSTGILYCFSIRSADGKEFIVGSDCVHKTTQEGKLLTDVQALKKAHDRKKRQEKRRIEQEVEREQFIAVKAALVGLLDSPEQSFRLRALPHPKIANPDLSLYDYLTWMVRNAGLTGLTTALKLAKEAIV